MFNQKKYINDYDKKTYSKHLLRVRNDDEKIINKLKSQSNTNKYLLDLIRKDCDGNRTLTIKQIKEIAIPIFNKYNIKEIYLFGSYARGEAKENSDVDFYCERGSITNLKNAMKLNEELESKLNKSVDIIFNDIKLEKYFKRSLEEDLIKLC